MRFRMAGIAAVGALLAAGGCVSVGGGEIGIGGGFGTGGGGGVGVGVYAPVGQKKVELLGIPSALLPSAGQCRLWFPGEPPDNQRPPGACEETMAQAPADTWVLYRPSDDPRFVHVRVIDAERAGVVVEVRVFEAESGKYVRSEAP